MYHFCVACHSPHVSQLHDNMHYLDDLVIGVTQKDNVILKYSLHVLMKRLTISVFVRSRMKSATILSSMHVSILKVVFGNLQNVWNN